MTTTKKISLSPRSAQKLCAVLSEKCGTPEGGSPSCYMGRTEYQLSWHFREDDGSAFARLGLGPTRKMVTLSEVESAGKITCKAWIHVFAR